MSTMNTRCWFTFRSLAINDYAKHLIAAYHLLRSFDTNSTVHSTLAKQNKLYDSIEIIGRCGEYGILLLDHPMNYPAAKWISRILQ